MDLFTALKKVKEGGRITRTAWGSSESYVTMYGGWLSIKKEEESPRPWLVSEIDMFANDWEVILN